MSNVDTKYDQWKTRLLDLSKRNRLLYFREFKRSSVRIIDPTADLIFQTIVQEERKLTFAQRSTVQLAFDASTELVDIAEVQNTSPLRSGEIRTNQSDESLGTTLYNLRSRMRSALEEQGVNILFLAFGILKWYEATQSTELVRTPLILVPVELDRASVKLPYTLEPADDDPLVNPTLAYKLQGEYGLSLPTLPEDLSMTSLTEVFDLFAKAVDGQPNWSISPEVVLGLFSFEKLVMLKDLEIHAVEAKRQPLIMALGGDRSRLEPEPGDLPRAEELDSKIRPEDTFQVLDADSSQQEAIAKAKRGVSLVIQGPPGTGKSQTIANLMAEFLAQNKRVLFVSAKKPAIDVVYQRLEKLGLHEFCLNAHGHKANKNEILSQLDRALQNHESTRRTSDEELKVVADLRSQLNAYVKALHEPLTALDRAPFYVHGLIADLNDAPDLNFVLNSVETIDRARLNAMSGKVTELAATAPAWQNHLEHPWRNTPLRTFSFQLKSDVQFLLSEASEAVGKVGTTSIQLAERFALPRPQNLQQVKVFEAIISHAVRSPLPPSEWFGKTKRQDVRIALAQAQETYVHFREQQEKLFSLTTSDLLSFPDLDAMRQRFEKDYTNVLRIFKSSYKQDLGRVQATLKTRRKLRYGEARTLVELAHTLTTTRKALSEHGPQWQLLLGRYFRGNQTDWGGAKNALDWTEKCRMLLGTTPISTKFVEIVCGQSSQLNGPAQLTQYLGAQQKRLVESLDKLKSILPPEKLNFGGVAIEQASLNIVQQRLREQLAQVNRLEEWIQFETVRSELDALGLASFVASVITSRPAPEQLLPAFLKRFYYAWLDSVYTLKPILKIKSDQRTRLIEQFRKADYNQLEFARKRVQAQLWSRRPDSNLANAKTSEVAILRKELQRKRHRPIRRLFSEIPNLLLVLTPCLMMSPLSVSMFLSGADFAFDAVIFDEASQVVPEDAIASMMRAKQTIVAGDTNQLPPTSFFRTGGIESEEVNEENDEILESILQECSSFLPATYLKWHYRSRHESLIAFSNQNIYANRLVTFPSVVQSASC